LFAEQRAVPSLGAEPPSQRRPSRSVTSPARITFAAPDLPKGRRAVVTWARGPLALAARTHAGRTQRVPAADVTAWLEA
jgi:hypothetical protein